MDSSVRPGTSFQRTLTGGGLLAPYGRGDSPPPASGRWAGHHPPYLSGPRPRFAAGGEVGSLNSDRYVEMV
jgi:hypothetical protein